jgi:CRP/FNR family transcriptional regulator
MKYNIETLLPFLREANEKVLRDFKEYSCYKTYSRGEYLALEGDRCTYFYLLVSGSLRIYKGDEEGREITLYKVKPGESCILSAFCIINGGNFPANALVDEEATLIEIPANVFRYWLDRHDIWREYVFTLLSVHLSEIINKIASLVFLRTDERIARFLVAAANKPHNHLKTTHSDIARELGTAREVVSRILKSFERERFIRLSRGNITIVDPQGLMNHSRTYSYAG